MKLQTILSIACLLLLSAVHAPATAMAAEQDYLSMMAEESEIKAIAEVTNVRRMSGGKNGSFMHVTFKKIYSITPYTPKQFVGGCTVYEQRWQTRSEDMVYFKPKRGHKVFVTITSNGGAITSYTHMNRMLETVIREEPYRLTYSKGQAKVRPADD